MLLTAEESRVDVNLKINENTMLELRWSDRILSYREFYITSKVKLLTPEEIEDVV